MNATLTSSNGAKEVITRQSGKLIKLFVTNDEKVTDGQMLAWIESVADHKEVIHLYDQINQAVMIESSHQSGNLSNLFGSQFKNLGELQAPFQQFISSFEQFNDGMTNGYQQKREKMLLNNLTYLKKIHTALDDQYNLLQKDMTLTQEGMEATNSLYNDSVISKQDLRELKSKLLTKQLTIPQLQASLLANENQQIDKKKDIEELEHIIYQQKINFRQALQTLKSTIDDWMKKYIVFSPTEGKISFIVPIQENQFLQAGKVIGFVNPSDSRYYAQVTLAQNNFGKITVGQKVQLRFDAYPYQEFGTIEGRLEYISKVPSDSGFLANISLPNGLMTNYHKEIQYRNGLKSQAIIIVKDYRLLERFYHGLSQYIKK